MNATKEGLEGENQNTTPDVTVLNPQEKKGNKGSDIDYKAVQQASATEEGRGGENHLKTPDETVLNLRDKGDKGFEIDYKAVQRMSATEESCEGENQATTPDEMVLMQKKRSRAASPRRRRRARAGREEERKRQERRHSWQVDAASTRARTATCSSRPLAPPWTRGRGRATSSRLSSAPRARTPGTSSRTPPASVEHEVPDIPPLGDSAGNIVWWAEMLGLQDPMLENNRVLENATVECLVENLRSMSPNRRTAMVAQFVPFLGALMAEVLRAINLAQLPAMEEVEIEAEVLDDDDEAALYQLMGIQVNNKEVIKQTNEDQAADEVGLMQHFDASIPFGSKLSQLQGHLEGFDSMQSGQVASHLQMMVQRLRRLAGTTSLQVTDRFQRLEALITSYYTDHTETPLSLQVWSEGQLRALIPYLNGGRTPDAVAEDLLEQRLEAHPAGNAGASTGASSSGDAIHVEDSIEAIEPEYRVQRTPEGPWEPATEEEAAEFKAHDEALKEEGKLQEEADRLAYHQHEAALAQQWEDWAVRSEMDRVEQPPSKKRVKITVCAGTSSGATIGEATIVGVIAHNQQAMVSFNVVETLVGGVAPMDNGTSPHADPQLACYESDHLPDLSEVVQAFMVSVEGRHWLWRFGRKLVSLEEVEARFGQDIAEAFQLWTAMQMDTEKEVVNVAERLVEDDCSSSTGSSTIRVERDQHDDESIEGAEVARVEEAKSADESGKAEEGAGVSEDNLVNSTGLNVFSEVNATLPDSGPDGSVRRAELSEAEGDNTTGAGDRMAGAEADTGADAGSEMDIAGEEPSVVPAVWENVLEAWNHPSIGAGLPDSALSSGEFQHEAPQGSAAMTSSGSHAAADALFVEAEAASNTGSSRRSRSSTDRAEGDDNGLKQTDLKGWLK